MKEYFLSIDLSTNNAGFTLWNEDKSCVEMTHLKLISKEDNDKDLNKIILFKNHLLKYFKEIEQNHKAIVSLTIIEEPLPNTGININTTALLLGFNGMARYVLYEITNKFPIKMNLHKIRRTFCDEFIQIKGKKECLSFPKGWTSKEKKHYIWEKVNRLEPNTKWIYNKNNKLSELNYDMSDSYACGYAYFNSKQC